MELAWQCEVWVPDSFPQSVKPIRKLCWAIYDLLHRVQFPRPQQAYACSTLIGGTNPGSIDSLRISVTLRGSLVGFVHPQRADARPRLESPF